MTCVRDNLSKAQCSEQSYYKCSALLNTRPQISDCNTTSSEYYLIMHFGIFVVSDKSNLWTTHLRTCSNWTMRHSRWHGLPNQVFEMHPRSISFVFDYARNKKKKSALNSISQWAYYGVRTLRVTNVVCRITTGTTRRSKIGSAMTSPATIKQWWWPFWDTNDITHRLPPRGGKSLITRAKIHNLVFLRWLLSWATACLWHRGSDIQPQA